ncbi:hypothetical protein [Chroococcidiopsis sp. CCALA 051]|nr:hypothetical protein [Chroococcidiopsis sp. CCALA 051]
MKLFYRGTTSDRHPAQADNRPFQQVCESGAAYNLKLPWRILSDRS